VSWVKNKSSGANSRIAKALAMWIASRVPTMVGKVSLGALKNPVRDWVNG
jgi:hypothetical protein